MAKKLRRPSGLEFDAVGALRTLQGLVKGAARALEQMEKDLAGRQARTTRPEKKKTLNRWIFEVGGKGAFPFDMLRHDTCWPRTKRDVESMNTTKSRVRRRVTVVGTRLADKERWRQFNWAVEHVQALTVETD